MQPLRPAKGQRPFAGNPEGPKGHVKITSYALTVYKRQDRLRKGIVMFTQIIDPFVRGSSLLKTPRRRTRRLCADGIRIVDKDCASATYLEQWTPADCSDCTRTSSALKPTGAQATHEAVRANSPAIRETREMQNIPVAAGRLCCTTQADDLPEASGAADCVDVSITEYVMIEPICCNVLEDVFEQRTTTDTVATTPQVRVDTESEKTDFVWIDSIQAIMYQPPPRHSRS